MAQRSSVVKVQLTLADIDHNHYDTHTLTLAQHPSETDERVMMRVLAFALNAHESITRLNGAGSLTFGAGLSDPDEPDVVLRDDTGRARVWLEVGLPEEKPLMRACRQADVVRVYAYASSAALWWQSLARKVARCAGLEVYEVTRPDEAWGAAWSWPVAELKALQVTVLDGAVTFSDATRSLRFELTRWC